jgi:hypothetical protein
MCIIRLVKTSIIYNLYCFLQNTASALTADEIMAENEQLRKRLVKERLKRKISHQSDETFPKVRRTSAVTQDSSDCSLEKWEGGNEMAIYLENWEGSSETTISLDNQHMCEGQSPICQEEDSSPHESHLPNIPFFNMLGIEKI